MSAWKRLLADEDWCHGKGAFPLPAYSECMPPPWVGRKPYPHLNEVPSPQDGEYGWTVTEYEQEQELRPGLEYLAAGLLHEMVKLGLGKPSHCLTKERLRDNPAWPAELASRAGRLPHERYVLLATLALSRTQDDKGRVPWTLFGASEQGPGKGFWRGFFTAPGKEAPTEAAFGFLAELLARAYGLSDRSARDPGRAGLRVLPMGRDKQFPFWNEGPFPAWATELTYKPKQGLDGVKFLLTFRPFAELPADVKDAYVEGRLHLLPFPGNLVFWHMRGFRKLARQLPFAMQLPVSVVFSRRSAAHDIRIPQAGYLDEFAPKGDPGHRPTFVRTHRWQKVLRHEDETALIAMQDPVTLVLFSTKSEDIDLYNKPMARNVQIWSKDYRLILDGLAHGARRIARAEGLLARGGVFGYRFLFPPMRVGPHEVYWHRPVAAFAGEQKGDQPVVPQVLRGPTGYLTAYHVERRDMARPIELWPVFPDRPPQRSAIELFRQEVLPRRWQTTSNIRSLLEWRELLGEQLTPSIARAVMAMARDKTLEDYFKELPSRSMDPFAAHTMVNKLFRGLAKREPGPEPGITFARTATRRFEEEYWATIATLAHGRFRTKCNADCVRDEPSRAAAKSRQRDLDVLAAYLLKQHQGQVEAAGVEGAWVGEHRFSWRTDFDFDWMGGWLKSQRKPNQERNLIVRIPGRDPRQAVILADHYDTAFMHDRFYFSEGGTGARVAAAGADDNHSATAMLLLAAPIFLELSKAGRLGCDVWLVHLTGEEFPSDCLGARRLSQDIVQGTLRARRHGGGVQDLSKTLIRGLYVCDMIAHTNERDRYAFQMAPGEGKGSAWLAKVGPEPTRS
ncbi:MAG: M28 family peptidase [Gemmataceae bacterium]